MVVAFSCALEVMRLVLLADSYDKVVAYGSEYGCWELLSSPRAYYTGIVELRRSRYDLLSAGCSLYLTMGPEAGLEALGTMTFPPSICIVSCPHRDMSDSAYGQEPEQHSHMQGRDIKLFFCDIARQLHPSISDTPLME
ncbi:hypothetical protein P7K49_029722 [Saguinus oedipus]|uniref:Uncharacterized protein n=1 Tax=Saguinus oedipus TaxID=9490 RepID=A0ABQ9U805_SAGOE|nr:hypothetical protein P7K49_029722 [Saguinus oedipus]